MDLAAKRSPRLTHVADQRFVFTNVAPPSWLSEQVGVMSRATVAPTYPTTQAAQAMNDLEDRIAEAYRQREDDSEKRWKVVSRVIDDASYLRMKMSFSMILKYLVADLTLVAVGIAGYAWATHPPKVETGTDPIVKVISLKGITNPVLVAGTGCDAATLKVVIAPDGQTAVISGSARSGTTCALTNP
jgi:hypothetical protein